MRRTREWRGSDCLRRGRMETSKRCVRAAVRGRVEQEAGRGDTCGGDGEGSDSTGLCVKDREGEKDLEDTRHGARHGARTSTVHRRMDGGEIFCYRGHPRSAASCIRLIYSNGSRKD
jgi:hypothetical protein